jgi:hypothetical protein
MKEQHFKNHRQFVPLYHGFTLLLLLAFIIGSIRNFLMKGDDYYNAALLVAAGLIIASLYYYTRVFALKAQDRAIRAEEGLRHFILTGNRLDPRLTTSQVVALRFAGDEEFPALAQRVAAENLSNADIKKAIRNWRSDWHRV